MDREGIEIRSPGPEDGHSVALIELEHPIRGRVIEKGRAACPLHALFNAAARTLGIEPDLVTFQVRSSATGRSNMLAMRVDVELARGGRIYLSTGFGVDLMRCALGAWLQAAEANVPPRAVSGAGAVRPYQVTAVDENRDLWLFASNDRGAADAIRSEFEQDGYSELRWFEDENG